MSNWAPDDALVEKAARAMCEADGIDPDGYGFNPRFRYWREKRDQARAALIACRDDMVAEAVKAEAVKADALVVALRLIKQTTVSDHIHEICIKALREWHP